MVRSLIARCVTDNVDQWDQRQCSEDLCRHGERQLFVPLRDLGSIFDVTRVTVECDVIDPATIQVSVEGEHKNGERVVHVLRGQLRFADQA